MIYAYKRIRISVGVVRINFAHKIGVECLPKWVLVLFVNTRYVADDQPIDPYVSIDADEHHLDKSTTKPKTFDPVWNESFTHEVHNVSRYALVRLAVQSYLWHWRIALFLIYLNVVAWASLCSMMLQFLLMILLQTALFPLKISCIATKMPQIFG